MKIHSNISTPKIEFYTGESMNTETLDIQKQKCPRCKKIHELDKFINTKGKIIKTCQDCQIKNKVYHKNNNKQLLEDNIQKECTQCSNNFINKIHEISYNTCQECREKSRQKNKRIAENRKNGIKKAKSYSFQSYLQVQKVKYKDNEYLVCRTLHKQKPIYFVIDYHKRDVLEDAFYHTYFTINGVCPNFGLYSDNGYIARQVYIDEKKKTKQPILLHNILLDNFMFCGKGANISGDHLNRCPRDNRLANLRNSGQTYQNYNQRKKARKNFEKLDFNSNFIPKNICFNSSKNTFTIEFKETDTIIYLQSILDKTDKKLPNSIKLLLFQEILSRAHEKLPLKIRYLPEHFTDSKLLEDDFNAILRLTTFPKDEIEDNIAKNHEFVFATNKDSFNYERKSGTFYVLVPTEEQKEQIDALIEKYDKEINDKVQEIIEAFK